MNSVSLLFQSALQRHQAGNLQQAELLCRQILQLDPRHAATLHLLGVIAHQVGRSDLAIDYMQQAVRLQPEFPEALNNLGTALAAQGRLEEAVTSFQHALRLKPNLAQTFNNLGNALMEQHILDEAIANFQQALRLKPDYAEAYNNLGNVLKEQGKFEEAVSNYRQALRLTPNYAEAHMNLGNALKEQGKFDDAIASYRQSLRLKPDLAQTYSNLGNVLMEQGLLEEAIANFQQALRLKPNYAEAYNNLGNALKEEGKFEEAFTSYQQALRLKPNYPEALMNLGNALRDQGRLDEAVSKYQEALRLKPDFAEAYNDLGKLHEVRGEPAQAEAAFQEALRLKPAFAVPLARLAMRGGKLPGADQAALEQRLTDSQLDIDSRASLLFALAHVLDECGDYVRAGDSVRDANALRLKQDRARRREYSAAEHERFVDALLQVFGPAFFKHTTGAGSRSRRPVFVFGLPRSGTTLVEQVLASHSLVHGAGELRLARQSFDAIPDVLGRLDAPLACAADLDVEAILRLAQAHDDRLRALGGEAERVVDKAWDNYMYLGLLAVLFPRAVFIHCRRDLRDVALSCWMTDFASIRWASDPEHIASRFRQYRRLMDHWRAVLPVPIHPLNYEAVVNDLEGVARPLLAACGLDWEPACLEFHRTRRPIHTASAAQVRQPIYQRSVGRWRNYQGELAGLFALLPAE